MQGPFFIFIMKVVTPKGRTESTSILSRFSRSRILEQTSIDLLVELQTPTLGERQTPVQEAMLRMALRQLLALIFGMTVRLMRKTARRSMLISSTSMRGSMLKQGPPATVPALLTTMPMSRSFHSSKMRYRCGISFLSAMSQAAYFIWMPLYLCLNSSAFSLHRSSLRLISSKLNPNYAKTSAKPCPMPCVKPVMTTQQSPYFFLRAGPLSLASLAKCEGSHSQERQFLQSQLLDLQVSVATPVRKSSFCRVSSSLLKSSDLMQSDTPCRKGEAQKAALAALAIGLQSTRRLFNMDLSYYLYKIPQGNCSYDELMI